MDLIKFNQFPINTEKMKNLMNRSGFIKLTSLTGISLAMSSFIPASNLLTGPQRGSVENDFFTIQFDLNQGVFNILRKDGIALLTGGTSGVNSSLGKRILASNSYQHKAESKRIKDLTGNGWMLRINSKDRENSLNFETQISLYDHIHAVFIEVFCTNVSGKDIHVNGIEPLRVLKEVGGSLFIPGVSKCLSNGAMYYDAGMIHSFGTPYQKPEPYGETKGGMLSTSILTSLNETVRSWWNAGFFSGYDREGLVLGFVDNLLGLGQLLISKTAEGEISFLAESVYAPGFVLKNNQAVGSNRLMINIAPDPYTALETYADIVGFTHKARTQSIVNGWCNWFYTYDQITEEEVIRNAEFASKNLKAYGFEYIQVDEGFQRFHGDWEGNDRFPHGMKWLADQIKSLGLKPGIWISPFLVSEQTELFKNHPDWFLKNTDGSLKRVGPWPSEDTDWARTENPKRYGLDITHPEAAKWLYELTDTIVNRWGYQMIKIDFVAWSILSADHFYDATVSPAQAYRKGLEIMRNAAGEQCHILDCGPGPVSIGLIDSMRIELDQNYGYAKDAWKQYFMDSSCSAAASAKRYYFHKRTWVNDADHVCINLLPFSQAQAVATIIAMSGGNMISGDRLINLDAIRLELLKKVMPSYGEAARPVDLFDKDIQTVFALKVKKSFGEWTIAGFFNPSLTESVEYKYGVDRLWLDPYATYLAYDFWKEQFVGEVSNDIRVVVQPGSVTLLTIHKKSGIPQFLSTDRHVMQGAIELESTNWDPLTKTLSGVSLGPENSNHHVMIYLPDPHPWVQGKQAIFHDYANYSLKLIDEHLLSVQVRFNENKRVEWKINPLT
jgi:hypothetical protein